MLLDRSYKTAPVSSALLSRPQAGSRVREALRHKRRPAAPCPLLAGARQRRGGAAGLARLESPSIAASASVIIPAPVTHHIAPDIDAERDGLIGDLVKAKMVEATYQITGIGPTLNRPQRRGRPLFHRRRNPLCAAWCRTGEKHPRRRRCSLLRHWCNSRISSGRPRKMRCLVPDGALR